MTAFFDPVSLDFRQVQSIVQAMAYVAASDGTHERELVLIRQFYDACSEDARGLSDFGDVVKRPWDPAAAKALFAAADARDALLRSCYLVAYSDGRFTDPERTAIAKITADVGSAPGESEHAHERVRDQLMLQVARSENVDAVREIAKKLG